MFRFIVLLNSLTVRRKKHSAGLRNEPGEAGLESVIGELTKMGHLQSPLNVFYNA